MFYFAFLLATLIDRHKAKTKSEHTFGTPCTPFSKLNSDSVIKRVKLENRESFIQ